MHVHNGQIHGMRVRCRSSDNEMGTFYAGQSHSVRVLVSQNSCGCKQRKTRMRRYTNMRKRTCKHAASDKLYTHAFLYISTSGKPCN